MSARMGWAVSIVVVAMHAAVAMAAEPATSPQSHARAEETRPPYVTSKTVKSWLEEGQPVTFLDVREADEFVAGHIDHARNIPYDQVASLAADLPTDTPIVLYCIHSAHRAPEAAKMLQALGFTNAVVLEGGIVAWQADGLMILASNPRQSPTILPVTERCDQKAKPSS